MSKNTNDKTSGKDNLISQADPTQSLKKPIILYVICAIAFAYAFYYRLHYVTDLVSSISVVFSMVAILLIFSQNKVLWTVASSWILVSIMQTMMAMITNDFPGSFIRSPAIILIVIDLIVLAGIIFHFRYPYLNYRQSLIGFGQRKSSSLPGTISTASESLQANIIDVSSTGFGIHLVNANDIGKVKEQTAVEVSVPGIYEFKTKAKIVRVKDNFIAVRFEGWTIPSLIQHGKIVLWLFKYSTLSKDQ